MLKVLSICGSLRTGSYNAMVTRTLPYLAPAGLQVRESPSIGAIPLYNADLQATSFPEAVSMLGDEIRQADGVIFVTPEYNYSVPGVLKNAIDWVSRLPDPPFVQKPVAIQSASMGALGGARAQYHLRQILVFLDALALNKPEVFITAVQNKVDAGRGELSDEPTRSIIQQQLTAFAGFIEKVSGRR